MKARYRLFQRGNGIYFLQDNITSKQQSLRTRDKKTASRLCNARNEAYEQPAINLQIARAYLMVSDPFAAERNWQHVMEEMAKTKTGDTRLRFDRAMREKPFDHIRTVKLIETQPEHFLHMLSIGSPCTNLFLRRLHNFALDMDWLPKTIIPRPQWPRIEFGERRAITVEEHQKIIQGERNPEWRNYYDILWHIGGAQSDVASLRAEDVDWNMRIISFTRMKTKSVAQLHFGEKLANLLSDLPGEGPLFPRIAKMHEKDRAKQFMRRCKLVDVSGVSLHSCRYSWAERAKAAGYPERFAQEALGHKSKAVHQAYAKKSQVRLPSLEQYEANAALNAERINTDR